MLDVPTMKNQAVYRLGRVVFVPHYRKPNLYVGPGFPLHDPNMYYPGELLAKGFLKDHMALWERPHVN